MVKTTVKSCNDNGGHALISVTDHSTENAVKQVSAQVAPAFILLVY